MSDYDERPDLATDEGDPVSAVTGGWEAPATGVPAVDDVLACVEDVDDRPVEEHVAVFEQAHERLRRALDPGHG